MTKKIMLINETHDESRIAILEDNILQEMLIEHITEEQIKNNVYRGVVAKVQPSLQAAFVDFGNRKHGFLQNSEVNPRALNSGNNSRHEAPIQDKISNGQPVLVQVVKEAVDQKGAVLTTNISLPGRFMVLMPYSNKGGVSKKIEDLEERDRLKNFLSGITSGKDAVIIRTAGVNRNLSELKKDYTGLKKIWKEVKNSFDDKVKPGLIYREADVVVRTLRDYYTNDIQEIWIDNPETYQRALQFFKKIAPRRQKILKLFVSDRSLFPSYNIEKQVEQLTSREVPLRSGGSIVIDQTEALVAIDVNSGKSNQEESIHATALRTNLEAADEVARQLRLRNMGGLVVVDFIDMENRNAAKKVENQFQTAMKKDKAQHKAAPISEFGLMEISRQRLAIGISKTVQSLCPVCHGKGKIPSLPASTNLILRSIREMAAGGNLIRVEGELPLEVANHLLNECRQSITDLELEFDVDILLKGNPEIIIFEPTFLKPIFEEKYQPKQPPPANKKNNLKSRSKRNRRPEEDAVAETTKENKSAPASKTQPEKVQPEKVQSEKAQPEKAQPEKAQPEKAQSEKAQPEKTGKEDLKSKQVKDAKEQDGEFGIYSSCLFPDIKQLSEEEMSETVESFEKRLKGELEEEPYLIDKKFFWDSHAHPDEEEPESQPAEKIESETSAETTKSAEKAKTKTSEEKEAKTKEKQKDKAAEKKEAKRGGRKKSPEKPKKEAKISEKKKSEKKQDKASEKKEAKSGGRKKSPEKPKKSAAKKSDKGVEGKTARASEKKKSEKKPDKTPKKKEVKTKKESGGAAKEPEVLSERLDKEIDNFASKLIESIEDPGAPSKASESDVKEADKEDKSEKKSEESAQPEVAQEPKKPEEAQD